VRELSIVYCRQLVKCKLLMFRRLRLSSTLAHGHILAAKSSHPLRSQMMMMMIRSEFRHQRIQLSYPQGVEWSEFLNLLNVNKNRSLVLQMLCWTCWN